MCGNLLCVTLNAGDDEHIVISAEQEQDDDQLVRDNVIDAVCFSSVPMVNISHKLYILFHVLIFSL